jgi:hypothetical protein
MSFDKIGKMFIQISVEMTSFCFPFVPPDCELNLATARANNNLKSDIKSSNFNIDNFLIIATLFVKRIKLRSINCV